MSTSQTRIDELLAANAKFSESWGTPPNMKQMRAGINAGVLVLTCMDPRVVPEQFLGPQPRVAVFRNAGGRVSPDVIRTINVFQSITVKAPVHTVMVVHHTDCGMTHLTQDSITEDAKNRGVAAEDLAAIDFGTFPTEDLEKTIVDDVATLKAQDVLKGVDIRGFVLDTDTALLKEL